MVYWFIAAAIVSFIFGFIVSKRLYLYKSLSNFSLFWNYFVQFVKLNEGVTVTLDEKFLRIVADDCINVLKKKLDNFT